MSIYNQNSKVGIQYIGLKLSKKKWPRDKNPEIINIEMITKVLRMEEMSQNECIGPKEKAWVLNAKND